MVVKEKAGTSSHGRIFDSAVELVPLGLIVGFLASSGETAMYAYDPTKAVLYYSLAAVLFPIWFCVWKPVRDLNSKKGRCSWIGGAGILSVVVLLALVNNSMSLQNDKLLETEADYARDSETAARNAKHAAKLLPPKSANKPSSKQSQNNFGGTNVQIQQNNSGGTNTVQSNAVGDSNSASSPDANTAVSNKPKKKKSE